MGEMPLDTPLIRVTEVPDDQWRAFMAAIEVENEDGFRAYVRFLTDARFIGTDEATLRAAFSDMAVILVADALTFEHPEQPVLCIDPEGISPSFWAPVRHLWIVENNVSIGNLLFEEIAEDQVTDGWLVVD